MSARAIVVLAVIASALSLFGCARDGILRLDVELREGPGSYGDRSYLVVEVAGDATPESWSSQSFATQGVQFVALSVGAQPAIPFDVISSRADVSVSVRVRYCRAPACTDADDVTGLDTDEPGFRFSVPRSIWIGHVTHVRLAIPPIEREGLEYASIPASASEASPYPASGWICRCQVRCEDDGEDTNEFGSCDGTRQPCAAAAPHPCD